MTLTTELTALEEKAVTSATGEHNVAFGAQLTPEQFFEMRVREMVGGIVQSYRTTVKGKMERAFDSKTPQEQAAILASLGVS